VVTREVVASIMVLGQNIKLCRRIDDDRALSRTDI
jgi:hypothetical protein